MTKDKIHVTTRAAIIDNGYLLLCKTIDLENNFYFMPGGHVEHMETVETALLRELEEETGSKATLKRMLGVFEYIFEPGHSSACHNHEYSFYFEATLADIRFGSSLPKLEHNVDLMWVKLDQLADLDFRPEPLVQLLPIWLAKQSENAFYSKTVG